MSLTRSIENQPVTLASAGSIDVSIVIPCLNEAETIKAVVENALKALNLLNKRFNLNGEVVVADNGSTDGSTDIAKLAGARIENIPVKGYGSAIRGGIAGSTGRFIIIGDADGSHNFLETLPMVESLLAGNDLCVGSRFKGDIAPGSLPFLNRYIGNPLLTGLLNLLFGSGLSDAHCGLRAITRSAFTKLKATSPGMEFASEMLIKASLLKLKRTEVPVTQHKDGRGRPPHLRPLRDGWRHLRYMLLLAPITIFLIPSMIFFCVGTTVYFDLILQNGSILGGVVGTVKIGEHWLLLAVMSIILSHTLFLFGVTSFNYSISQGYRLLGGGWRNLKSILSIEYMLIQSLVLMVISAVIISLVFFEWMGQSFRNLEALGPLSLATTLLLVGIQHFFGSFLVNIFND
ncbi:glycosyltransferase family 2 protein [uncultured Microbulbifer sp.]|uniref:glycosyltransferase family 2 protein n=1 Tax=uncultured Microbulbifer sp. TaxID=348147 RepID=UPI0026048D9A|nr:glycosyltransferase family 2 protein [uncultured Microbulbifer sp.]